MFFLRQTAFVMKPMNALKSNSTVHGYTHNRFLVKSFHNLEMTKKLARRQARTCKAWSARERCEEKKNIQISLILPEKVVFHW